MAVTFNITFYLFCLWSCIQVIKADYCDYVDGGDHGIIRSKYCYYGCCFLAINATLDNVCCILYDGPGDNYYPSPSNTISTNDIIVGSLIFAAIFILVITIVTCCCCRKRQATQGLVLETPVVYSNTVGPSTSHPSTVLTPPPYYSLEANNSPSDPPPSYDTVASPVDQDVQNCNTHTNANI
ncbi:hypothetical protein SNE40_015768 [Patella caerulea]|uniref:Uncharacterized protein n=1 Tax=Patella caerulea TaxID=87958 RepID=A0AAN8JKL1_PATCE